MIPVDDFEYAPSSHNAKDWQRAIEDQLVVLDGICREHGLKYSLAFGGLLGAIRHRGMIPWDNDADIVMFEDDYLKLQQLSRDGQLPEGYQLVDRTVEEGYPLLFGRFVNTKTACPLSTSSFNGGINGVFIDVFILFPVPEQEPQQTDCITDFLVWEEMQCHIKRRCKFRSPLFCERWRKAKEIEAEHGRAYALKQCEENFRSKMPASSSKCIPGSGGRYMGYPVFDTAWFQTPVYKPFGSHEFAVPNGYLSYLRCCYGDSWRTFPAGERFHAYSAANLNIPGYQVVKDYMQFIDQDQAVEDLDTLKQLKMEEMLAQSKRNPEWWGMKGELQADLLNKEFASKLRGYRKVLNVESIASSDLNLSEVADIRKETDIIVRYQLCSRMKTWHVAMPFKPELLSAALWSRFLTRPDFWTVEKVIGCQRADKRRAVFGKSELDENLQTALKATGDLYEAIDGGEKDTAVACTGTLDRLCSASMHAAVGHAFLAWSEAGSDPQVCEAVFEKIDVLRQSWPDNDYLQLFAMECAFHAGDHERAQELCDKIAQKSFNGMVLLRCQEFCEGHGLDYTQRDLSAVPTKKKARGKRKITFPSFHSVKGGVMITRANLLDHMAKQTAHLKMVRVKMKPYSERDEHYRALRRLTSDRLMVWERMFPRKQALLSAAKAGRLDEVRKYSVAFLDGIYRIYDNDHMGLCVDWDILQACLPLLEEDRGREFVDEYLSLIPEPHKENMDSWMRRMGIDHPYFHQEFPAGEY